MTRQSAHILMTSRRLAEFWNIQCLPSSLAATRSTLLFTPNGLPQRMQQNGSSSLSTRAGAVAARKSSCGLQGDDLLGAGRLAQPALHAGILGEAQHRALRIVGSAPVGQADTHARQSVQPSTLTSTVPNGAPAGSGTTSTGAGGAVQLAQRETQHVALAADGQEAAGRGVPSAGDRAERFAERDGIVGLDRCDAPGAEAEAGKDRLGERDGFVESGDVVARLRTQQKSHARRAVGESGRDVSIPTS